LPFLRLTRDRRGFENTFLLHADRPGDRPRLLYWYRTAPGIMLGRSPLDEDAIRTIEDSHPDIEFDWPAILALSEVMTPEDEAPARPQPKRKKQGPPPQQQRDQRPREPRRDQPSDAEADTSTDAAAMPESFDEPAEYADLEAPAESIESAATKPAAPQGNRLLEELVGREIAGRLRARYAEIMTRIHEKEGEGAERDAWVKRAEPLNPDSWVTPDAILDGVRAADSLYDSLKGQLSL
jgi:hypothetical protein